MEITQAELEIQAARMLTQFQRSKRGTVAVSNEDYERFFHGCKPQVVSHLEGKVVSLALDRQKAITFLSNKFGLHNVGPNSLCRDSKRQP